MYLILVGSRPSISKQPSHHRSHQSVSSRPHGSFHDGNPTCSSSNTPLATLVSSESQTSKSSVQVVDDCKKVLAFSDFVGFPTNLLGDATFIPPTPLHGPDYRHVSVGLGSPHRQWLCWRPVARQYGQETHQLPGALGHPVSSRVVLFLPTGPYSTNSSQQHHSSVLPEQTGQH